MQGDTGKWSEGKEWMESGLGKIILKPEKWERKKERKEVPAHRG
jgi:hypothetical protein